MNYQTANLIGKRRFSRKYRYNKEMHTAPALQTGISNLSFTMKQYPT